MPQIYIVIVNYNKWEDLKACLTSIFRSDYDNFKVIVVDNNSENDSLGHLTRWAASDASVPRASSFKLIHSRDLDEHTDPTTFPRLLFVQHTKNVGFAGGVNVALRHLTGQDAYIWLLNPDLEVEENALSELVRFAEAHPVRSITGTVIKFEDQRDKIHMYGGGRVNFNTATATLIEEIDDIPQLDYISGGSLFTRAENFRELGILPAGFFIYWEETDWCFQARAKGYELNICLTAICYDKVSTTMGRGFLAEFYYTRNGLFFVDKYKKEANRRALFAAWLRLIKRAMSGQWSRVRGVYRGIQAFKKKERNED
ncbi:MAG TPA: glycosyltransferase family 2 protein [Puia sp.]|nr:glycosyltransferase family 2 protein [Puia sp.]